MADLNEQIKKLQDIIAKGGKGAPAAQVRLDRLIAQNPQVAPPTNSSMPPDVSAILAGLTAAMNSASALDPAQLRKAIADEVKKRKIDESDLTDKLLARINSSRKVEITIPPLPFSIKASGIDVENRLMQRLLSDADARNNIYLYGSAGTGKSYSAEILAKLKNYKLITINCNQFTSPIDIIGGQTITGYQEGKLSMAWSNVIIDDNGAKRKVDGCVLLLDELPKIDPNTAGLMNEALAKVKQFKTDAATGKMERPTILNGRNQELELGNLIIIAAGNVALNTIDADYEANFKQDLSLQDRFIGSTYKVGAPYKTELDTVLKGYAFLWLFTQKLRTAIAEVGATSQAFVSMRLMNNLRETYNTYRRIKDDPNSKATSLISNPKTIDDAMQTFFQLFKPSIKAAILQKIDYPGFLKVVEEKDKMPFNEKSPDFNTAAEVQEANTLLDKLEKEKEQRGEF